MDVTRTQDITKLFLAKNIDNILYIVLYATNIGVNYKKESKKEERAALKAKNNGIWFDKNRVTPDSGLQ